MARAGTFVVQTLEEETVVGTGYAGVRPRDYAEGGRTSLERFFKSVPLLSLARPHPTVFVLRVTDTLPHALAVLGEHGFLSAPVLNQANATVGMVSVNDLASALVVMADIVATEATGPDGDAAAVQQRLREMWAAHTVGQVLDISGRSPFVPLPHTASVWDALERLGRDGAHSVVVMKEDGSGPEALYSQAAVLAYLFHHLPHFRVIARKMVQQVGNFSQQVGAHKPLHVAEDAPLLEAFRLLRDQAVTGVMVLSHGRKLIGVISATDVRMLGAHMERGDRLFSSAGAFVHKVQKQNPLLLSKVVSCTPVDTVGMVMEKMLDNAVHRVFVVRTHHGMEEEVPLDVLAMRDILLLFQPEA
jgi:CBS domain-containing protein